MENNNKKGISKRTLRTKIILLVILAVIMVPLIILYKSVGDTTPKIKLYDRNQTESSSESGGADSRASNRTADRACCRRAASSSRNKDCRKEACYDNSDNRCGKVESCDNKHKISASRLLRTDSFKCNKRQ